MLLLFLLPKITLGQKRQCHFLLLGRHGWVGDSRTSASTALPGSSSSSTASFRGALFDALLVVLWKNILELNLNSRGENIDKMPVVVISMISRCQSPKLIYPALPKIIFLVLPSYFSASACPPPSPCSGCGPPSWCQLMSGTLKGIVVVFVSKHLSNLGHCWRAFIVQGCVL